MCKALQSYIFLLMNLGAIARRSPEVGMGLARPQQGLIKLYKAIISLTRLRPARAPKWSVSNKNLIENQ